MVKTTYLVLGAIPVIVALLISVPMLTKNEIPISIEYTKHQLKKVSFGVAERVGAQKTEILYIKNDGDVKYSVNEEGYLRPDIRSKLDEAKLDRIKALIKETGFMSIPSSSDKTLRAANSFDRQLKKISFGVAERVGAQKTEILYIKNDGDVKYSVNEEGYLRPDIRSKLDEAKLDRIKALIKETGFMSIPSESFEVPENVTEYQKSNVKVTLNGRVNQIFWPEPDATPDFIPPIITMVEAELDQIISDIIE